MTFLQPHPGPPAFEPLSTAKDQSTVLLRGESSQAGLGSGV